MKPLYAFETYRDRKREWRWRLRHRNGRIVAEGGEGYKSHATMKRSVQRMFSWGLTAALENAGVDTKAGGK